MGESNFEILYQELLPLYLEQVPAGLGEAFEALHEAEVSNERFSFYTSVSAMASSKIEGEPMEIDSFIKYKMLDTEYLEGLVQKPDDLYRAYIFAQKHKLSEKNFLQAHNILAAHLLPEKKRGVCRLGNMVVMEHQTFRIQYEAALGTEVKSLFKQLWNDIEHLKKKKVSVEQVFYFASIIHLTFVSIHPFEDGNGRAGRLLEKWFLAEMLGEKAWFVQSELYYYQNVNQYYRNLNRLGMFYDQLDYSRALPFLLMLPQAVIAKGTTGV